MFGSILEKYKALLDKFGSLSIAEVVRCFRELHKERCDAFEKFLQESKQRVKVESNSCISNYVKQADKNESFFEQINRLHGQIQLKHNQIYEDEVEYWKSEFAKVEREIAIKLKMRFNEKAIFMGSVKQDNQNREIRWIVIGVDLEKKWPRFCRLMLWDYRCFINRVAQILSLRMNGAVPRAHVVGRLQTLEIT